MNWWEAVVLGIIQGLTEFLPISSSAHVRVFGSLLLDGADPGAAFSAIIQLGTEAAVLVYFAKDIGRIIAAWWRALLGRDGADLKSRLGKHSGDARMGWFVSVGTLPSVVLGVLLKDQIEGAFRNLWITAFVLAAFAIVLAVADKVGAKKRELSELRTRDAVFLGFAQAAALVPGVSRSGGTISMGLFLGLTRTAAARYSFLLAIPAVIGSASFEIVTNSGELTAAGGPGVLATVIATIVAFFVGYAVIVGFLKLISTQSFMIFVAYRILFAAVIAVLLFFGYIDPLA